MTDSYTTIARESHTEIKVKGSRFIGETFLVDDVPLALERLETVRKREYSATHHCYAYIVGLGIERLFKYSDDGEPSGTAGKPIFDVVEGAGVTDILCVVTRYFGGTKLGTGGLARAYSDAARAAMEQAGLEQKFLCSRFRFELAFSLYDRWQRELHELGATVEASDFSDKVNMRVTIRNSLVDRLVESFARLTAGKGKVEPLAQD